MNKEKYLVPVWAMRNLKALSWSTSHLWKQSWKIKHKHNSHQQSFDEILACKLFSSLRGWCFMHQASTNKSQYICCCSILIRRRACNMSLPSQVTFRLFATNLIEKGRLSGFYKWVIYLKIGSTSFEFANKLNMFEFKYK